MRAPIGYFESTWKSLKSFWAFVETGCSSFGRRFIGSAMVFVIDGRAMCDARLVKMRYLYTHAPVNGALGSLAPIEIMK
jgi:hypothetical protein